MMASRPASMNRRRKNLLSYIIWYQEYFQMSPTIKEIVENFGYSDGTARHHLSILVRLNHITWNPKEPRSIRLRMESE